MSPAILVEPPGTSEAAIVGVSCDATVSHLGKKGLHLLHVSGLESLELLHHLSKDSVRIGCSIGLMGRR